MAKRIFAFIDAPDPDNFFQVLALYVLSKKFTALGIEEIYVVLTGRCVKFDATKETETWEWDYESSILAQQASAMRLRNFMRHFGINNLRVFDGGIAPRTQVPHHVHFKEYYKFLDVDPLYAIRHSELESQDKLVKLLLEEPYYAVVGGPMTGLYQAFIRNPLAAVNCVELHSMFATWGEIALQQFDDNKPRGANQFNVYCDNQAAKFVMDTEFPKYMCTSEVTRDSRVGFENVQALAALLPGTHEVAVVCELYKYWFDAAIVPRLRKNPNEMIWIHDLSAAFSLFPETRGIYDFVPVSTYVPHKLSEKDSWGELRMTKDETSNTFAAKRLF